MGSLSGGARTRIGITRLMIERPDLLLLDEPTNNLDLDSIDVLERALQGFDDALLVVSHDPRFLEEIGRAHV